MSWSLWERVLLLRDLVSGINELGDEVAELDSAAPAVFQTVSIKRFHEAFHEVSNVVQAL